ncbi:hypothetical protein GGP41_005709 [Bipolaris sorokiniana]|uniref:Uncharacterized protein n=1 Tax=Cochliobolus sativus TaxID=45130 RepID=A0A8H6DUB6_COCSA|nr:hypothetical protein GGP41_005709 [Bipolaris sorokiniana]
MSDIRAIPVFSLDLLRKLSHIPTLAVGTSRNVLRMTFADTSPPPPLPAPLNHTKFSLLPNNL